MSKYYDWGDPSNNDIVFPTVAGVAVYKNSDGDIVIRQQGSTSTILDNDDAVIVIPALHAQALILALQETDQ